ncbi:MAG: cytidine deaminase [Thermoanaerobacteraceae bacterium]|nr:cytidine deaminase [Thermoanaerobacteraceae bacterium]
MKISPDILVREAMEAREKAYAPYSNFKVGAAVLTESGRIYRGCNIENDSYGLTICAERVAIFKAVSEGEKIKAIAVTSSGGQDITLPCGACRQVIQELCPGADLLLADSEGNFKTYKISDLLPMPFKL